MSSHISKFPPMEIWGIEEQPRLNYKMSHLNAWEDSLNKVIQKENK